MSEIAASVRAPNQLLPRGRKKNKDSDKEKAKDSDHNEMDEMNVVANIVGYTAPLGASSADMGEKPTKPGQKLKKRSKSFVRWK